MNKYNSPLGSVNEPECLYFGSKSIGMIIVNLSAGISLLILGLIIQTGKVTFLIAGYNAANKEK